MGGSNRKMAPSSIRFSQDNISRNFSYGDPVHDVIDDIKAGTISPGEFLPINVAYTRGHWYAENNRSLYVFRVLEYEGKINEIDVHEVRENTIWRLMSTTNQGTSIQIRGGERTRPHSVSEIEQKRSSWGLGTFVVIGAVAWGLLQLFTGGSDIIRGGW